MVGERREVAEGAVTNLGSPPCFLKYCRVQTFYVARPGWPWLQVRKTVTEDNGQRDVPSGGSQRWKDNRDGPISKTPEIP